MRLVEPSNTLAVSAQELADQLHIDPADIVSQLEQILRAATAVVETATNRSLTLKTVEIDLPEGEWSEFWLPFAPVTALIEGDGLTLKRGSSEPRLIRNGAAAPEVAILQTGYSESYPMPEQLREAVILLAMEWYKAGISVEGQFAAPSFSFGVMSLIKQIRYRRPCEVR